MNETKDYKLFISLLLWYLLPSLYMCIRMHIISAHSVDIDILGQMEWFDLIDETLVVSLTMPLYYLLKRSNSSGLRSSLAFLVSFSIYTLFTAIAVASCSSIAQFMRAESAVLYLTLQSFSMLIGFISTFMILLLTINGDYLMVWLITIAKLICLIGSDIILIRSFAHLGSAYSEMVVYALVALCSTILVIRRKYISFRYKYFDTTWLKEWVRIGFWSSVSIFLANIVYALAIVRMININSNAGNYWLANEFIWKWLIIPVTCLYEVIKKNDLRNLTYSNSWIYCLRIIMVWLLTVPLWSWFLKYAMAIDDSRMSSVLEIIYLAMPFFGAYIICQIIEAWFISKGKTFLVAMVSAIVNLGYYGIAYILFYNGFFAMDIKFIICLFGLGMVVACLCNMFFYKINVNKSF